VKALLLSTYDLGRQPFGLASGAAALGAAGIDVACGDLAKERLNEDAVRGAQFVGFFLPMHTATRLALPVIDRVRALNPAARLCAFGLYAPLNEGLLRERGIARVIGGEFEDDLVRAALGEQATPSSAIGAYVPRVTFRQPDRRGLLPLARYATLQAGAERRIVGYTEASRGCKHRCRHCPIVPVYDGRFRVVPPDVVLADVDAQVAAGARHITFGDPDFFNGIRHAIAVVRALAQRHPGISYDVTIKVEHLLVHADALPVLADTGCAFVTSAVESIDDEVLRKLEKGHGGGDFERAVTLCREAGVPLVPTFVAFTPWTTVRGYCEMLAAIDRLDLVEHVSAIQLAIRLLIPQGSRLLELPEIAALAGPFDPVSLTHRWQHTDPRVDALQRDIEAIAGGRISAPRRDVFARAWEVAHAAAGMPPPMRHEPMLARSAIPYLNEPWYC
jgi:hypothetical protein